MALNRYYDNMADNYIIPKAEMTAEMWGEAQALLSKSFYDGGYVLMTIDDGEGECWCITSFIE